MMKFKIEADKYGLMTVSTPKLIKHRTKRATIGYEIGDFFFTLNCQENQDGTRSLILNGDEIHSIIGRRLKNWDIPHLKLFLAKNLDVTKLNLANNEIKSAGFAELIDYLFVYDNIVELNLENNYINDAEISHMHKSKQHLKLRVLNLRGNKIGVENLKKVALTFADNSFIEHIDVAETDPNEEALIYFIAILRAPLRLKNKLRILDISRPCNRCCCYYKLDSQHIAETVGAMLKDNTTLEELYLQKFNFDCHDVEDMVDNAIDNKTLKVLDLSCNNIGDYGAEVLSKWLINKSSLQSLILAHNDIYNAGVSALGSAIPLSTLSKIDISYNRFDDCSGFDFVQIFVDAPLLKKMCIYGSKVGTITAKVIEVMFLINLLKQENVDVQVCLDDDGPYLIQYKPMPICDQELRLSKKFF